MPRSATAHVRRRGACAVESRLRQKGAVDLALLLSGRTPAARPRAAALFGQARTKRCEERAERRIGVVVDPRVGESHDVSVAAWRMCARTRRGRKRSLDLAGFDAEAAVLTWLSIAEKLDDAVGEVSRANAGAIMRCGAPPSPLSKRIGTNVRGKGSPNNHREQSRRCTVAGTPVARFERGSRMCNARSGWRPMEFWSAPD